MAESSAGNGVVKKLLNKFHKSKSFAGVEFASGAIPETSNFPSLPRMRSSKPATHFVGIEELNFHVDVYQEGQWVLSQTITDIDSPRPRHIFFDLHTGLPTLAALPRECLGEKRPRVRTDYEVPDEWKRHVSLTCVATLKGDEASASASCEFTAMPSRVWYIPQRGIGFPPTHCLEFRGTLARPGVVKPGDEELVFTFEARDSRVSEPHTWQVVKMAAQVVKKGRGLQGGTKTWMSMVGSENSRSFSFNMSSGSFGSGLASGIAGTSSGTSVSGSQEH